VCGVCVCVVCVCGVCVCVVWVFVGCVCVCVWCVCVCVCGGARCLYGLLRETERERESLAYIRPVQCV